MNYKDIFKKYQPEFEKSIAFFKAELAKIRAGLASPSLVDSLIVDYMGTKLPMKQIGSISCPEPRQILIQPWDKSCLESIERAVRDADLGLSPVVDKDCVRINMPIMTEEFRLEMKKNISEKKEQCRQTVRRWREECWREVEVKFKAKEITEDDKFRAKDELQKIVDDANKKIEDAASQKEREIMG